MIPTTTRLDILNDRFAYTPEEIITVNASQLCEEIIAHDKLKYRYRILEDRIALLTSLLQAPNRADYRHIDLRA